MLLYGFVIQSNNIVIQASPFIVKFSCFLGSSDQSVSMGSGGASRNVYFRLATMPFTDSLDIPADQNNRILCHNSGR
jgi:hypothetical protein